MTDNHTPYAGRPNAFAPAAASGLMQEILAAFPLFDDEGLDEEEHHCEWALQQDRKRLHTLLGTLLAAPVREHDCVFVPRVLIGAACSAIDRKQDAPKTLEQLRRYTVGDLSATPAAQPAPVQEPVAWMYPDVHGQTLLTLHRQDWPATEIPLYNAPPAQPDPYAGHKNAFAPAEAVRNANVTWRGMKAPAMAQPAPVQEPAISGVGLAAIGCKHFGNPIPPQWYAAAKELLAAAPPAAQRQPLTMPQIIEVTKKLDLSSGISWLDVIRAVEAAHGITPENK